MNDLGCLSHNCALRHLQENQGGPRVNGGCLCSKIELKRGLQVQQSQMEQLTKERDEIKIVADTNTKTAEHFKLMVKKAFWWSAEFTHITHGGKIQAAWEDFNDNYKKLINSALHK